MRKSDTYMWADNIAYQHLNVYKPLAYDHTGTINISLVHRICLILPY